MSFPPPRSMYTVDRSGPTSRLVFYPTWDVPSVAVARVSSVVTGFRARGERVQVVVPPETPPAVRTALRLRLGLEVT